MQAAIDRAAATRIPNSAEELVTMFGRAESINANLNVDVVRALLVVALFIPPAISDLRRKRRALASLTERT